jgi:ABC-2 type transport system permease protein
VASSVSTVPPPSRWLPLWAVLEMDLKQTLRGWLYRLGMLVAVLVSIGVLLNRAAVHRQAGHVQFASVHVGDFLQYSIIFGAALCAIFAAGAIAGERGTMTDSILSRGVARWHYYLGKWAARQFTIVGGFLAVGLLFMVACVFLLRSDLSFYHCLVALILAGSVLALMVSLTIAVSAMTSNTLLCVGLMLILLYGLMAFLWLVPLDTFTLTRFLNIFPALIRAPDPETTNLVPPMLPYLKLAGNISLAGLAAAFVGMVVFLRKDV